MYVGHFPTCPQRRAATASKKLTSPLIPQKKTPKIQKNLTIKNNDLTKNHIQIE